MGLEWVQILWSVVYGDVICHLLSYGVSLKCFLWLVGFCSFSQMFLLSVLIFVLGFMHAWYMINSKLKFGFLNLQEKCNVEFFGNTLCPINVQL